MLASGLDHARKAGCLTCQPVRRAGHAEVWRLVAQGTEAAWQCVGDGRPHLLTKWITVAGRCTGASAWCRS